MTVKQILEKHARPEQLLDSEPVKSALMRDLEEQKRTNSLLYGTLFGAVCAVMLAALYALAADLVAGKQARLTVLAGAGVSVPAALAWMLRVVREWSQLNLLITILAHEDESGTQALIKKLISNVPKVSGKGV